MPRYEFRCRECASSFEVDRPMSASGESAECPAGHADTVRLLSTTGLGGRARTAQRPMGPAGPVPAMAPPGGGCCGGGCCG